MVASNIINTTKKKLDALGTGYIDTYWKNYMQYT